MDAEERRAITAAGPTNLIVSREDLLGLIDATREAEQTAGHLTRQNRTLRILAVGSLSLWLWHIILRIAGVL